jgi:uncharacterized membrane protein YcaP (DUF421 family)
VAAHKQGFHSLSDIDAAEIEPGGALTFVAKTPSTEETRDQALHDKLDALSAEVAQLTAQLRR